MECELQHVSTLQAAVHQEGKRVLICGCLFEAVAVVQRLRRMGADLDVVTILLISTIEFEYVWLYIWFVCHPFKVEMKSSP